MTINGVLSYGVRQQHQPSTRTEIYLEELRRDGYAVLPDVFTSEVMAQVSNLIDSTYALQVQETGKEILEKANDADIVRCPLAYDRQFLDLSTNETIQSVVRGVFGENYVLLQQNGIINRSKKTNFQTRWHRDLSYQHWVCSQPLLLNFLICIDKFFVEGGATWILPGSHLHEEFPSDSYVSTHAKPLEAGAGSVIILDGMTYHRGGVNIAPGYIRRALNNVVGLPFMGQQIDIPRLLDSRDLKYSADPFLYNYLGYRWNPVRDAASWREQHAEGRTSK